MENVKNDKGITLIALVITIIILLILAGISIATLTGQNGLLTKANNAKEEHLINGYKEELNLIITEEVAERTTESKKDPMIESLEKKINNKDWVAKTSKEKQDGDIAEYLIVESKEGYEFIIEVDNEEGTAKIIEANKTAGEKYTITYHPNGGEGKERTVEVRKGFKKKLEKNNFTKTDYIFAGWCEDQSGNGEIYLEESTPPLNEDITLYAVWTHDVVTVTFDNNTGTGKMDSREVVRGKESTLPVNSFTKSGYEFEKWNTRADGTGTDYIDKITINEDTTLYAQWKRMTVESAMKKTDVFEDNTPILDENGKQVIIPGGFKVAEDSAKDITQGIVIEDKTGNQFVWVPVDNPTDFVRVEGYSSGSKQSYLSDSSEPYKNASQEEKDLYWAMYNSVTNPNNKGFYIGRYEAGKEEGKVVVKKNKPVYANVKWSSSNTMTVLTGGAVELSKNFINDKSYKEKVTSTLIYGVQWDTTLKFFNNETYLKNSKGKGWYEDNYRTGNLNHLTGIDVDSNASNKVKNIYDMAGNVEEWTMEAYASSCRFFRGGNFDYAGNRDPASGRTGGYTPTHSHSHLGFRLALYL